MTKVDFGFRQCTRQGVRPIANTQQAARYLRLETKRMKTKWDTCNIEARPSLEHIVVHERVHLLERHHNDGFEKLMDNPLPSWRTYRDELNATRWPMRSGSIDGSASSEL